ncbi:hypothetical protein ACJMK2_011867 [Sinanodonta woodiana]|uniref:Uncharacterized protein n=1 Tax=Sinanodonta woodiana TaxID=1069815 RepID=A0ABD3V6C7_SINWO
MGEVVMANLVPGFLFRTPGLNRNFPTPFPNTATPKEKIIARVPDPVSHSRASCTDNPRTHGNCYDSVSLHKKPEVHAEVHGLSSNTQRSINDGPTTHDKLLASKTAVNQKRHTTCQVPIDPKEFIPGMMSYTEQQHSSFILKNKMISQNPDMPNGAEMNLCNVERIYSSRNLLEQKRKQYIQLLIQRCRGVQSMEYVKYSRYINQSKTGPLPSKTGWSRPVRLPKLVISVDSTKDNSQKLQTSDDKTHSSFEVIQKSQSDLVGNSKGETKKPIKPEQVKCESTKQAISTDHSVTGVKSHNRSRPSYLTPRTSRHESQKSQTSSKLQRSSKRDKDVNSKDEPKYANFVQEDQKPTDVKQEVATDEINKTSQEHGSHPSTVLSIHGHVERPESGKSISSKDKDVKMQLSINEVEEKKSKSSNKAESLVSIRSNDNQQIYRVQRDMVDKDTDERESKNFHSEYRDLGGEVSPRERNNEIHQAQRDSVEREDGNVETRKASPDI